MRKHPDLVYTPKSDKPTAQNGIPNLHKGLDAPVNTRALQTLQALRALP
jgi:hypothetical protein